MSWSRLSSRLNSRFHSSLSRRSRFGRRLLLPTLELRRRGNILLQCDTTITIGISNLEIFLRILLSLTIIVIFHNLLSIFHQFLHHNFPIPILINLMKLLLLLFLKLFSQFGNLRIQFYLVLGRDLWGWAIGVGLARGGRSIGWGFFVM